MLGYFSSGSSVAFSGLNLITKFLKIPKNCENQKKNAFQFLIKKKIFKCMHDLPEVHRNCSCKTFWSTFLALLFKRACCSGLNSVEQRHQCPTPPPSPREGVGCHNFLHFLLIIKIIKICVIKTAACTLYSVQCTLFSVLCTVYTVKCTVCTELC